MKIYQGQELRDFATEVSKNYKERYLLEDLHRYMTADTNKICCMYGLRRTGKSVMMAQEIKRLNDFDNCLFILCEDGDRMWDIGRAIDTARKDNPQCRSIFLDEITKADRFIDTCSSLGDMYAVRGIKVVASGTHSLGFYIASGKELLNRAQFIHTTYIPFKEFNHVLGKGIHDYIRYGGTLTDGEENVFYNSDIASLYTNSAIVENITKTLKSWNGGNNYTCTVLRDILDHNELPSFINKVLELSNRSFLAKVINSEFKAHDLGSLVDLMNKHPLQFDDPKYLETEEMRERARIAAGIKKQHFNQADEQAVNVIIDYLKKLDVLYEAPTVKSLNPATAKEYIFTQVGMRYCQAVALSDALITSEDFGNYNELQQHQIRDKLISGIKGNLFEDIVFYQLAKEFKCSDNPEKKYAISKYRNADNKEIDILVMDYDEQAVLALEVKLSSERVAEQREHLLDDAICKEIEDKTGMVIASKAVIYLGEHGETEDGVLYINGEDFLKNSKNISLALLHEPVSTYERLSALLDDSGKPVYISEALNEHSSGKENYGKQQN